MDIVISFRKGIIDLISQLISCIFKCKMERVEALNFLVLQISTRLWDKGHFLKIFMKKFQPWIQYLIISKHPCLPLEENSTAPLHSTHPVVQYVLPVQALLPKHMAKN